MTYHIFIVLYLYRRVTRCMDSMLPSSVNPYIQRGRGMLLDEKPYTMGNSKFKITLLVAIAIFWVAMHLPGPACRPVQLTPHYVVR